MSLLEAVVALLILALGLLALAAALPPAVGAVTAGGTRTAALLLARQGIEAVRATPYGGLGALDTGGFAVLADHPDFERAVEVRRETPRPGTTTVTVAVRPIPGGGAPAVRESALVTVVAE